MRMPLHIPWLCLVWLLLVPASRRAGAQAAGTVSGTVIYGDTGKPAIGILPWLELADRPIPRKADPQTGEYEIRDADQQQQRLLAKARPGGSFIVTGVPPGTYVVHAYAPPYLSPDDTIYPTSNTAHVAAGSQISPHALRVQVSAGATAHVMVRLQRGGAIEGMVTLAESGSAASEAIPSQAIAVNAERKLGENSYARTGGVANTDERGRYRLEGLAPGDYVLFAARGGPMVPTVTGLMGSSGLPIYAPGTVRAGAATVVHIAGMETAHANIALPPRTALHRIRGSIAVHGRDALRHVTVRLYPKGEGGLTAATPLRADAGFGFEDVPDGEYTLSVEFPSEPEIVGLDTARGVIRMRTRPAPYAPLERDVTVAGQDREGILLRPEPADTGSLAGGSR